MSRMTRKRTSLSETKSDDTLPKRLQVKSLSEAESHNTLLKRMRRTRKFSEGLVRLGSKPVSCDLQLFPLGTYSLYVRRRLETIGESDKDSEGSPLVMDLPDCPGDVDIFGIVGDFCLGLMDEYDISISNVVKLIAATTFLEMESLKLRALKFLEEIAFNSWKSCLGVLATFEDSDLTHAGEGTLFHKCEKAFLRRIEVNILSESKRFYTFSGPDKQRNVTCTMSCSVRCLGRVAQLLRPNVAKHIYESCSKEKFGLFFDVNSAAKFPLSNHFTCTSASIVPFYLSRIGSNLWCDWIGRLSNDLSRKSMLVLHLAKLMHLDNDVDLPTSKIQQSTFSWDFLSALLVELITMAEPRTGSTQNLISATDLDKEIENLQMLVGCGLGEGNHWRSTKDTASQLLQQDLVLTTIKKFTFETLRSLVRHFRDTGSNHSHISFIAKILDSCLLQHLKDKKFTVQQALLIYQEFPNDSRSTHAEIYHVFEDFIRRKALSLQEVLDLLKLLDYKKVSDEVLEELMAGLQVKDCDSRLWERFMEKQQERQIDHEKSKRELVTLRNEHTVQSADLMKVRRDLEEEKEKTTCQICFAQPRDALSLPCMHFLYCSDCLQQHHRKSKNCPTCRASTTGVLKCIVKV